MKVIIAILSLILFVESVNVFHWMKWNDTELSLGFDQEGEDEKKSETETIKFDKSHQPFHYDPPINTLPKRIAYLHNTGSLRKGDRKSIV